MPETNAIFFPFNLFAVSLPVFWKLKALQSYSDLICFMDQAYLPQVGDQFAQAVEDNIRRIAEHPRMFQKIRRDSDTRRCVLQEHHALFYRGQEKQCRTFAFL